MALSGGKAGPRGSAWTNFPGLAQSMAETKRVRRGNLRQAVKDVGFDDRYDETLPCAKVMDCVDNGFNSGNEHIACVKRHRRAL